VSGERKKEVFMYIPVKAVVRAKLFKAKEFDVWFDPCIVEFDIYKKIRFHVWAGPNTCNIEDYKGSILIVKSLYPKYQFICEKAENILNVSSYSYIIPSYDSSYKIIITDINATIVTRSFVYRGGQIVSSTKEECSCKDNENCVCY